MAQRSAPVAAAPAPKPATPAATRASAAAGTRAAGGAAVALQGDVAPGELDLKAMGDIFKPPEALAGFFDSHPRAQVRARFGTLAQGVIEVRTEAKGRYRVQRQRLALAHPLFARIAEAAPGLEPCLVVVAAGGKLSGHVGLAMGSRLDGFDSQLAKAPEILGLAGIRLPSLSGVVNRLEGGRLKLGLNNVPITLGQAFNGKLSLTAEDTAIAFEASATVSAKGLADGSLQMKRSVDGLITGRATIGLKLPKNFSGSLDVAWDGRAVNGEGKVGYRGEKLSGEVMLRLMERSAALQLEQQKKAPPEQAPAAPAKGKAASTQKIDYVVFGEGDLAFAFTSWLNGTAHVIVDPKGFVTIIGKITPQREFELFPQKDYVRQIFKIEVRASYGIPVVGNIFIFANVGMDAFAKIGPGKFYKIVAQGTYSTDPAKCQDFSIQGTFNISAAAGARLRGEAGAGLEIVGHDIKAGAGVNGIAGIKGYAEATPIIGYREKAMPGEDKKGEWFIRGEMEIVAQPFLGLSGDLFVEVDAPWWSPVPDKKWTWPLDGKEWPLGGPLGIGATVDYVFGSGQWPKLDFKPVEFSADKFMTELYADKAKSGKGGDVDKPGQWKEKNSEAAEAPPKASPKGNAAPGKAAALPPAKARVQPGGTGKGGKHADPNARTASGKTVKQYQDEAAKKGKKPPGGEVKAGSGKESGKAKDGAAQSKEDALKNGLAALQAVVTRYASTGATKEEVETGVKSVRNKFKNVFKYIKVSDAGESWQCEYAYNPATTTNIKKKKTQDADWDDPTKWPAGTKSDPIPIKWYKREDIYPRLSGKTPTQGITLPPTPRKPARWLQVNSDQLLGVGKVFTHRDVGRPPEDKKEDVKYQLDAAVDAKTVTCEHAKYSIDHVRDLAWMGQDVYTNLWPLDSTVNNQVNASHYQRTRALFRGKPETRAAKSWGDDKYFVIAKIETPPSGGPGAHGTDDKKPANSGQAGVPKKWS